ncbi:helix-turn-helix domain-containing protein [Streptomonospora nanhaiensis]|uniref:helix-turn-helix domain-containing protein n=2 Tax=Streptomonospora nanhaiensis TaxID=1323731 RepID=UPI001C99129D|nr:helix-turn-helix domain-containing protein [Streptomonospora nanhaiensis]MBX9390954.1 helix-turn-helix domain-containing protein [Streptomonospora nanhaiensis]
MNTQHPQHATHPAPQPSPRFYTPAEVRDIFRISQSTVRRWTDTGHIRTARTVGGHRRLYADDVDALLHSEESAQAGGG